MKSKKANNAEKLLEATMLALQGKLELKENKVAESRVRTKSRAKKNESIDVNVDEKTNVSVEGNETVVDTEDATVVINKKDNFVPETSDGIIDTDLPSVESPAEETVWKIFRSLRKQKLYRSGQRILCICQSRQRRSRNIQPFLFQRCRRMCELYDALRRPPCHGRKQTCLL